MLNNFFSIPDPLKNISATRIGVYSCVLPRQCLCAAYVRGVKILKQFKVLACSCLGSPGQKYIMCAHTFTRVLYIVLLIKLLRNSLGTIGRDRNINVLRMGFCMDMHRQNIGNLSNNNIYWSVIKGSFLAKSLVRVRKTAGFFRAQFLKWTGKRN